jgi:hypothetical protein
MSRVDTEANLPHARLVAPARLCYPCAVAINCPACDTELDPSNTNCPVCLRPLSRKEMMRGLQQVRKKSRPGVGLPLAVTAAVCLGGYAFLHREQLGAPAAAVVGAAPATAPAAAPAADAPQEAPPPDSLGSGVTVLSRGLAALGVGTSAEAGHKKRSARPDRWGVHGHVYDLMSVKPIVGARLVFQDRESGKAYAAKTDARGAYRVSLPKLKEGGYDLTVNQRGYRSFLEEMSPPYRNQSRARRLEAREQALQSEVLHVPLLPEQNDEDVQHDLVMLR